MLHQLRKPVAIGALALFALVPGPVSRSASAATTVPAGGRTAQDDKWWGTMGAALCGLGIRTIRVAPEIGMNPYVLAATIGGCVLAVLDQT